MLTTKINIGNERLVPEVVTYGTIRTRKVGQWESPCRWIGRRVVIRSNVAGDIRAVEEPNTDTCITELHGINLSPVSQLSRRHGLLRTHATPVVVEGLAISFRRSLHAASGIVVSTVPAVLGQDTSILVPLHSTHGA